MDPGPARGRRKGPDDHDRTDGDGHDCSARDVDDAVDVRALAAAEAIASLTAATGDPQTAIDGLQRAICARFHPENADLYEQIARKLAGALVALMASRAPPQENRARTRGLGWVLAAGLLILLAAIGLFAAPFFLVH